MFEDDEDELDLKEIREKECKRRDMINSSSSIFAVMWFHRNASIRLYVTKFPGSEKLQNFNSFFLRTIWFEHYPIATYVLCFNILFEQYTLALLSFLNHESYCYSIIQLKYQTIVLPENTVQTYCLV